MTKWATSLRSPSPRGQCLSLAGWRWRDPQHRRRGRAPEATAEKKALGQKLRDALTEAVPLTRRTAGPGPRLHTWSPAGQKAEAWMGCAVIKRMTCLGLIPVRLRPDDTQGLPGQPLLTYPLRTEVLSNGFSVGVVIPLRT
jgi:hypothetical protein